MSSTIKRGKFIVLEGLDGSGKTTLVTALKEKLARQGIQCAAEREPSDGELGVFVRGVIKRERRLDPVSVALLFAADRYQHAVNTILPALKQGVTVLCDRYLFSNMAYQGLSMPMEDVLQCNKAVMELLMPDLTLFVDTAPEQCAIRMSSSRTGQELFDNDGPQVRASYLKAFELLSHRSKVVFIDGGLQPDQVIEQAWDALSPIFS